MRIKFGLLITFLIIVTDVYAVVDMYHFSNDNNHRRYQGLVDELRCPKCQNQNLAGSNSPIAQDLRRELHRMIEAGEDDVTIKSFMVKRYGNFILYKPPVDKNTVILWGLPIILGIIGLVVLIIMRRKSAQADSNKLLSASEKEQLENLLNKYQ